MLNASLTLNHVFVCIQTESLVIFEEFGQIEDIFDVPSITSLFSFKLLSGDRRLNIPLAFSIPTMRLFTPLASDHFR
jgi:hypothetical protein